MGNEEDIAPEVRGALRLWVIASRGLEAKDLRVQPHHHQRERDADGNVGVEIVPEGEALGKPWAAPRVRDEEVEALDGHRVGVEFGRIRDGAAAEEACSTSSAAARK